MKKISLVIPTIEREIEINNILNSICNQNYENLEVIVVDQNKKINIDETINKYKNKLNIFHYKVDFQGASKARNFGAHKATGEIINFPDDDCILVDGALKYVNEYFEKNIDVDAVFGKIKDNKSNKDILYFKNKDTKVKKSNVYQTTIEANMFIKINVFKKIGMFDENLGIGTYYGAEEGADLICRLLYQNYNLQYKVKVFFYHPHKRNEELYERVYSYGLGFGGFMYKHIKEYKKIYPVILYFILKISKNILCILYGIISLNKKKIKYNFYAIKGKLKGFLDKRKFYKQILT